MRQSEGNSGGGDARRALTLLHVFPSFGYGGQQARLAALARALGNEFRHVVVALDGDLSASALFDAGVAAAFDAFPMKKSSGLSLSNIQGLGGVIRKAAPDILCTYNWGSIEAAIANRLGRGLPHVHFEDGFGPDEAGGTSAKRNLARRLVLGKSVVVVPSRALARSPQRSGNRATFVASPMASISGRLQANHRSTGASVLVSSVSLARRKNYARLAIRVFRAADRRLCAARDRRRRAAGRRAESHDAGRCAPSPAGRDAPEKHARFHIFALASADTGERQ
ncbi:MAG: glycosyltransferase [Parvularculaceae bacterium]